MRISLSEVFGPVVQGEGPLIGVPTVFVRTGGCDYRCAWCDTPYAVLPAHAGQWVPTYPQDLFAALQRLTAPLLVTLSGGNPALQPGLGELIDLGLPEGWTFACETQGTVAAEWFGKLQHLILSPKAPSSGEDTDWGKLGGCIVEGPEVSLKVVVADEADYAYAKEVHWRWPDVPMYLQVCNPGGPAGESDTGELLASYRWLAGRVLGDLRGWEVPPRVLPQMHVLAWGSERGR